MTDPSLITFSFGKNWESFFKTMPQDAFIRAMEDSKHWIPDDMVIGKTVIDIGCGSGLHSLIFHQRGAAQIISFDVDDKSVATTQAMWTQAGMPTNWTVTKGSVLSDAPQMSLKCDIVYSWGVLHHTGDMWKALRKASEYVKDNGLFWFSLYAKGPHYNRDLLQKQQYNAASPLGKKIITWKFISILMLYRLRTGRNPFAWNEKKERGMDTYHDIIDWLGGLPYEVASIDEVVDFMVPNGFFLKKVRTAPEGSCHVFLFQAIDGRLKAEGDNV